MNIHTGSPAKIVRLLAAAALATLGSGCGGGGGSADTGSAGTTPVVTSSSPGSTSTALVTQTNEIRRNLGLPAFVPDTRLDAAATGHSQYFITKWYLGSGRTDPAVGQVNANGTINAHVEEVGVAGFKGVLVSDRAKAAGYPGNAGEVLSTSSAADAGQCVNRLIDTVFHRSFFTSSFVDMGVGLATTSDGLMAVCTLDNGSIGAPATIPESWTGLYPYPGQTGVPTIMAVETPDPVPEAPNKGYPISLQIAPGRNLSVGTFTLAASGTAVPVKLVTKASFPSYLSQSQAFIVPLGSLSGNTQYTVSFVGTSNSDVLTKTWVFTTAR